MKISRERLISIIKEELEYMSQDQERTVDDLAYELENMLGRKPTPEEIERIKTAVLSGDIPSRSNNE